MDNKCLLNHCLPEYKEYQEQIPNNFDISLKLKKKVRNHQTRKNKRIIKALDKCSKKYCSK
jgi:hypothetical protein